MRKILCFYALFILSFKVAKTVSFRGSIKVVVPATAGQATICEHGEIQFMDIVGVVGEICFTLNIECLLQV